ncbi:Mps one binder kinase activator-like 4 [Camponotus floridanus]|uniref:Mps one binder kinase activator-like 4 n=1 Tax=Camponotus floridanus TaxID=104421 RepID=E2ALW9_CAMFO|nr:Mps one binder kinase activator-like 4 [Camponotus floridanus]
MADGPTILRRNRPGTKAEDFSRWPDEPFEEMDSTLAVQQYIQQMIRRDPSNIDLILNMPEANDEGVWKYEHLRQFCMELNGLAVRLQEECHPETCTQMTATEQISIKESSVAKLGSVCRRVYRIFSHAYFHHRTIFDEFENETFLCRRFTSFVTKYNLMSKDNLIVPIMEGDGATESEA